MRILYITRKYPPSIGGMEKVNYILSEELKKRVPTYVIALKKSQKWLPVFFITSFFKALYISNKYKITNIHIGDAVLTPLGLILKILLCKKTTVTIYGLDITYNKYFYQSIFPFFVKKMDKIICISNSAKDECLKRGMPQSKCIVIHFGIYENEYYVKSNTSDLEKIINTKVNPGTKILITVGRLIPRKGVDWFINNVLSEVNIPYLYLVIGNGPEKNKITQSIKKLNLKDNVKLLNGISNNELKKIYSIADLFIMPNIKVKDDMEGFGMVLVEAASAGVYSIASNIEGITDAVISHITGDLVTPGSSKDFIDKIISSKSDRNKIRKSAYKNYSWNKAVDLYKYELSNE